MVARFAVGPWSRKLKMLPQWGGIFQNCGEDLIRLFGFSNGVASSEDGAAARTARSRAAERNPVPSVVAIDFAFHQLKAPSASSANASAISGVWHSKGRCGPGMQHSFG